MSLGPFMVRQIGVHEGHERFLSLGCEGYGDGRFFTEGVRRYPGMLNAPRALNIREPAVMGCSFERPVKEPVYFRIQDELFGGIPRITGNCWIQPRIEDFARRCGDCSLNLELKSVLEFCITSSPSSFCR